MVIASVNCIAYFVCPDGFDRIESEVDAYQSLRSVLLAGDSHKLHGSVVQLYITIHTERPRMHDSTLRLGWHRRSDKFALQAFVDDLTDAQFPSWPKERIRQMIEDARKVGFDGRRFSPTTT